MDIPFEYMEGLDVGTTLVPMLIWLVSQMLAWGFVLLVYILESLSLYTIANRRGIRHGWMAWVPVLNLWILGSICDQYQYVVKGKITNRRKVLLTTKILQMVMGIALFVMVILLLVKAIGSLAQFEYMEPRDIGNIFGGYFIVMIACCLVMYVAAIMQVVFTYIACHSLYASCDPSNRTVFTVLTVLLPLLMPFFFLACRKKDLGMPPRRVTPVQEIPPTYTQET